MNTFLTNIFCKIKRSYFRFPLKDPRGDLRSRSAIRSAERGFAALFVAILILAIIFAIGLFIAILTLGQQRISGNIIRSSQAYFAGEAGIEDAIYRIRKLKNISSNYAIPVGKSSVSVFIDSPNPNTRIITATGNTSNAIRKLEAILVIQTIVPDFFYGAQVGDLGIKMEENSRIEGIGGVTGNVYSNGSITGDAGATITGDVIVAAGGQIKDAVIIGNASANTIQKSKICGDAYYQIIGGDSLNFLNNPSQPTCPVPLTPGTAFPDSPDPASQNLPLSEENINQFKQDATTGGTFSGNFVVDADVVLGPKKIDGNLILTSNNKTLTVTGTIYVTGSIDISNGSTIRCSPLYQLHSCVVVADQWLHVKNNGIFQGSGQPGSFIMILSTASCVGAPAVDCTHHDAAIDLHNNATGAIFYAQNGLIFLHNGVVVSELVGRKMNLENNAVVQYEQGLVSASFSSGPGASWKILNWKEIE